MTVDFQSDGVSSTTIRLVAMHNNNGTEKIIGFDHVTLTKKTPTAVTIPKIDNQNKTVYDLQGRVVARQAQHGLFVGQGKKYIVK